jgi:DeoR/GlpR family transcriptional regulator of sugar metabolism
MQLLEILAEAQEPQEIEALARKLRCDTRTIRRDLEQLESLLHSMQGIELKRGKVSAAREGFYSGYFGEQLQRGTEAKEAIARTVLTLLPENSAIALTAGSTNYTIAQHIKRAVIADCPPRNLIVFTNSLPVLQEMIVAHVSTGVLGEIFSDDDCAFHTPEFRSAFQPSIAIVGASGVLINGNANPATLDLFSHRAEEAAFLKQLLKGIPEIIIAVDSTKIGKRHPWSFGGSTLAGKSVCLVTDTLTSEQVTLLEGMPLRLKPQGIDFTYRVSQPKTQ